MNSLMVVSALAATPALAQTDFTLTNGLSQAITGVNTSPLEDAGNPIGDHIGGFFDPLAPRWPPAGPRVPKSPFRSTATPAKPS